MYSTAREVSERLLRLICFFKIKNTDYCFTLFRIIDIFYIYLNSSYQLYYYFRRLTFCKDAKALGVSKGFWNGRDNLKIKMKIWLNIRDSYENILYLIPEKG